MCRLSALRYSSHFLLCYYTKHRPYSIYFSCALLFFFYVFNFFVRSMQRWIISLSFQVYEQGETERIFAHRIKLQCEPKNAVETSVDKLVAIKFYVHRTTSLPLHSRCFSRSYSCSIIFQLVVILLATLQIGHCRKMFLFPSLFLTLLRLNGVAWNMLQV